MNNSIIAEHAKAILAAVEAKPEPVEKWAAEKAAHKAGKVIEYRNGGTGSWSVPFLWPDWSADEYRIKPWTLPAPPAGREWHRTDWTEDMLPEGWRPLLLGEVIQHGDEVLNPHVNVVWTQELRQALGCKVSANHFHFRTRRPDPERERFEKWKESHHQFRALWPLHTPMVPAGLEDLQKTVEGIAYAAWLSALAQRA